MLFFIFSCIIAFAGTVSPPCPLQIIPPKVVVGYGDSIAANCSCNYSLDQLENMGWESPNGAVSPTEGVTFLLLKANATEWTMEPKCYTNLLDGDQCLKRLTVTIYKMADNVSVSPQSQMGPMVEGKTYRMQCDIANVAPARHLSVYWHKRNKIVYTESFNKELNQYPVNLSSVFNLTAQRDDNAAQIWCEAKLNFGSSGPNLRSMKSRSHGVIVLYPPTFTQPEKETVTLKAGGKIDLNCTARGNPMPSCSWHPSDLILENNEKQPILTVTREGTYNCTVSNTQGTNTKYFIVTSAPRDHTVLAGLLGGFGALAVVLLIVGYFTLKPDGTFSFCNGQPTSSVI
ncbi:uncharacterized protein LOC128379280 [Scomber scombrus]|uniref:Uncharacterized protein LOC128379280 n=1 Tax=Scomber scombrus TaxID=13677 RepID=A0AAV1PHK1_SCOSC|nr:intercellular adhesion molecule 4-like [Scomber scombrus]